MSDTKRREFLKKLALAGASVAAGTTSASALSKPSITYLKRSHGSNLSDTINVALIGAGGMGTEDTNTCLRHLDQGALGKQTLKLSYDKEEWNPTLGLQLTRHEFDDSWFHTGSGSPAV